MLEDELLESEPKWTPGSCLLTLAVIVLIGALVVIGALALGHSFVDFITPRDGLPASGPR